MLNILKYKSFNSNRKQEYFMRQSQKTYTVKNILYAFTNFKLIAKDNKLKRSST